MSKHFTIVGAGSVGIGTALHLQQRGFTVSLVDKSVPASQTSYGNAGVINASSFTPLNNPSLLGKLPRLLLNNHAYLRYNVPHVFKNIPWCYHFLRACTSTRTLETSHALHDLCSGALDEHRALMQRCGNMHRLSQSGWLKLFRAAGPLAADSKEAMTFDAFGVGYRAVTKAEIHDLEPHLKPIFSGGYLLSDSASVDNPGQLLREYVEQFLKDGGEFITANVRSIEEQSAQSTSQPHGGFRIVTDADALHAQNLVVCAGPWSADILKPLGYRVLLGFERGYHQHFNLNVNATLSRPIHDVDAGYILAPMEQGIRMTTGVELNHRDAPSNLSQLHQVLPRAREALPLGEPTEDPVWRGCRPTFPDSRPVIDRAPRHENLWMAFGHQHIGLMSGPVTGKLLTQKICDEKPDINLEPFAASRWVS